MILQLLLSEEMITELTSGSRLKTRLYTEGKILIYMKKLVTMTMKEINTYFSYEK